jgi:hypothetical protein
MLTPSLSARDHSDIGGEGAFKPRDMMQLMRNAFEGAWLPTAERGRYIAKLDNFTARLGRGIKRTHAMVLCSGPLDASLLPVKTRRHDRAIDQQRRRAAADLEATHGRPADTRRTRQPERAQRVLDATGKLVTPGSSTSTCTFIPVARRSTARSRPALGVAAANHPPSLVFN